MSDHPRDTVYLQLEAERYAQDKKWGEQNHRDGTGPLFRAMASVARFRCQEAVRKGSISWGHILEEEVYEAMAEKDPALLRAELIQVAAVAIAWVEAIDRRPA